MRLSLSLVFLVCAQAQPEQAKDLIHQLGSDDVAKREEAFLKLKQLGEAVLPNLEEAARAESPEVAARARELIRSATEVPKAVHKALKWLATNRLALVDDLRRQVRARIGSRIESSPSGC